MNLFLPLFEHTSDHDTSIAVAVVQDPNEGVSGTDCSHKFIINMLTCFSGSVGII